MGFIRPAASSSIYGEFHNAFFEDVCGEDLPGYEQWAACQPPDLDDPPVGADDDDPADSCSCQPCEPPSSRPNHWAIVDG